MKQNNPNLPFWQNRMLEDMTSAESERLFDSCGRCCMHKLENEEIGRLYETNVSCVLLDSRTCRCRDYQNRQALNQIVSS